MVIGRNQELPDWPSAVRQRVESLDEISGLSKAQTTIVPGTRRGGVTDRGRSHSVVLGVTSQGAVTVSNMSRSTPWRHAKSEKPRAQDRVHRTESSLESQSKKANSVKAAGRDPAEESMGETKSRSEGIDWQIKSDDA